MNMKPAAFVFATVLLGASTHALAHPQASGGLLQGFAHPFSGIDHLLAILIVGIWAARHRGAARLALPLAFLASMLAGGLLALAKIPVPATEAMIVASVVVFAAAACLRPRLGVALVGLFALFHGYTHINGIAFIGGMLAGTAVLLGIGLAIGLAVAARRPGFA